MVRYVLWSLKDWSDASLWTSHWSSWDKFLTVWPISSDPRLSLFKDPNVVFLFGFSGFQPGNSSGGRKLYPVYQQTRWAGSSLALFVQSWEGIFWAVSVEINFPSWHSQKRNKILLVHVIFSTSEWPHTDIEKKTSYFWPKTPQPLTTLPFLAWEWVLNHSCYVN